MASPVIGAGLLPMLLLWAQWWLGPMPSSASWLAASYMPLTCWLVLTLVTHLSSLVLASRDPDEAETVAQCYRVYFPNILGVLGLVLSSHVLQKERDPDRNLGSDEYIIRHDFYNCLPPCLPQTLEELCCQNDLARAPKMQRIPSPRRRVLLESQNKAAHQDSDSVEPSEISWKAYWLLCFLTTEGSR